MIAIGLGCRRGCEGQVLADLVTRARAAVSGDAALFTIEDKRGEPGLAAAAEILSLPLVFLPRSELVDVSDRLLTRSPLVEARFGIGSIAEAAALAGGGARARLLGPRLSQGGATCAVAVTEIDT